MVILTQESLKRFNIVTFYCFVFRLKYVNIPISNSTTGTSQSNGITSRLGSMSEDSQQINSIGTEMTSISSTPVGMLYL